MEGISFGSDFLHDLISFYYIKQANIVDYNYAYTS